MLLLFIPFLPTLMPHLERYLRIIHGESSHIESEVTARKCMKIKIKSGKNTAAKKIKRAGKTQQQRKKKRAEKPSELSRSIWRPILCKETEIELSGVWKLVKLTCLLYTTAPNIFILQTIPFMFSVTVRKCVFFCINFLHPISKWKKTATNQ